MKIVKLLLLIFLSLFAIVVVVIAVVKMQHRKCEKIEIMIHSEMKGLTVTQEEVLSILKKNKIKIVGEELKDVDQKAIFEKLKAKFPKELSSNILLILGVKHILIIVV
mgnify:CR=1 FL=1